MRRKLYLPLASDVGVVPRCLLHAVVAPGAPVGRFSTLSRQELEAVPSLDLFSTSTLVFHLKKKVPLLLTTVARESSTALPKSKLSWRID